MDPIKRSALDARIATALLLDFDAGSEGSRVHGLDLLRRVRAYAARAAAPYQKKALNEILGQLSEKLAPLLSEDEAEKLQLIRERTPGALSQYSQADPTGEQLIRLRRSPAQESVLSADMLSRYLPGDVPLEETAWPLPPVYRGEWVRPSPVDARALLTAILAKHPLQLASPLLDLRVSPAAFMPGFSVVELLGFDKTSELGSQLFLLSENFLTPLTGLAQEIHRLRVSFGLDLSTPQKAAAYLSFFCACISAQLGTFFILDAPDYVTALSHGGPPPVAMTERAVPPTFQQSEDGALRATVLVLYGRTGFLADFRITPEGIVDMESDAPVAQDLDLWQPGFRDDVRKPLPVDLVVPPVPAPTS